MSQHSPKTAALLAYQEGLLQPRSVVRLERHLAQCAECSRMLATIRAYEHVANEMQKESIPALQWDRMEPVLAREARRMSIRQRAVPVLVGVALAAVVLLGIVAGWPRSAHAPSVTHHRAVPSDPLRAGLLGNVTAVVGVVTLQRTGEAPQPVVVGTPVREGVLLASNDHAEAHVRWQEGTGSVIQPGTSIRPVALRSDGIELELVEGLLSNVVRHQTQQQQHRYIVLAGEWKMRVRGTRFAVYRSEDATAVRVDEGSVELLRNDTLVKVLEAPAFWSSKPGEAAPSEVRTPRALTDASLAWPVVLVPPQDGIAQWQIDGSKLDATGPLSMRVPVGSHDIVGLNARGIPSLRTTVSVGPDGANLADVLRPVEPNAPRVRRGHLAPELIEPVVRGRLPALRRCYDRVLRQHPELRGRYTLRITIDTTGGVQEAALSSTSEEPPAGLSECIATQAQTWSFPPPTGGIVTFELPLSFGTGPAPPTPASP